MVVPVFRMMSTSSFKPETSCVGISNNASPKRVYASVFSDLLLSENETLPDNPVHVAEAEVRLNVPCEWIP